jgi:hypothetical protein
MIAAGHAALRAERAFARRTARRRDACWARPAVIDGQR